MTRWLYSLVLCTLLPGLSSAESMLMGRVALAAEIVMAYAEHSIEGHGYRIAHRQTCDTGLGDVGYETDYYQVIFFGKPEEVRRISADHPELVSHLPLKVAVIAEKDETLLTALNPEALSDFFPNEALKIQLGRGHSDLVSIFEDVKRMSDAHGAGP
jgi:uncharacterized protein (DUF302 family)